MEFKQVVLTEKCNLNCKYCYIKQKENMMSKEIFLDIYKKFDKPFQLDLFGGEPLINWELIKFIVEKCKQDENCKRICLYTNGLLLDDEKISFIQKNNIDFFWSYDGLWSENKIDERILSLVKKLTNSVAVQVGPPNLNMLDNYLHYISLGLVPTFTLMRDKRWKQEDVLIFNQEFKRLCSAYVNLFQNGKNLMPKIIQITLKRLIDGTRTKQSHDFCGAGERLKCYMPDGREYPCARFGTNAEQDDFKNYSYESCKKCDIDAFCDKGCFHQVSKYGLLKEVCEINRIVITRVVEVNNILKNNKRWKEVIKQIEGDSLCTD